MNDEVTQVDAPEVTTETTTDNETTNSTGEGEDAPQSKGAEQRQPETPEQRVARLKRQLEREQRKLGIETDKGGEEDRRQGSEEVDERFARQDLKMAGITDRKEQDIVLKYAKAEGIDPEKAVGHPIVKAALDYHRAKDATPAPSNRTGGQSNSLEYWAAQVKKTGRMPDDPEMRRQLRKMRIWAK